MSVWVVGITGWIAGPLRDVLTPENWEGADLVKMVGQALEADQVAGSIGFTSRDRMCGSRPACRWP